MFCSLVIVRLCTPDLLMPRRWAVMLPAVSWNAKPLAHVIATLAPVVASV
jgi:hypothetical protein